MGMMPWMEDHIETYIRTNGEDGHMFDVRPFTNGEGGWVTSLLLRTKGRKTGKFHILPLMYTKRGYGYLVVGSYGGADKDPGWVHNIRQSPLCAIQVKDKVYRASAYILPPDERKEAWENLTKEHPFFHEYERRSAREYPLILLTPIDTLKTIKDETGE